MKQHIFSLFLTCLLITSCAREAVVPQDAKPTSETADIFPDYRDIVVPPNIAPLNIMVRSAGDEFVGEVKGSGQSVVAAADEDGKLLFDSIAWRNVLTANKGNDLEVNLYAKRNGEWVKFPAYKIQVAPEEIDRYLSYRLIEPSYELYRQHGLYQRDLQTFDEFPIYENNREYDNDNNHCVNCHNFQNYSTEHMLFHIRAKHGGTLFINGDKAEKMKMTTDSTMGNAVYPSWYPTRNWVAFSTNKTGQAFHVMEADKIEVVDYGSDLLFYDADAHTISNILKTDDRFETFPCWAPDGRKLYYCSAYVPQFVGVPDSLAQDLVLRDNKIIRYDVMSLTFDPETRTFGPPTMEVECAAKEKSAAVPRVSPDGKFLLYTLGDYGQFHIWHSNADLWVKNLTTGDNYPLTEMNSPDVDSYHGWSSNGRWIVVASRRIDGTYSRPFIAYFDKEGKAYKAFLLPQEDPEHSIMLLKSYNVPEFSRNRVRLSPEQLKAVIYDDEKITPVTYKKLGK